MKGVIGVIGPKRMDYEKVMQTLQNMKEQLDNAYVGNDGQSGPSDDK